MKKERRRFSKEEYLIRQLKVRESMNASNVDALIIYDPANMFWLTGYDGWSFYVHQCVVISQMVIFLVWQRDDAKVLTHYRSRLKISLYLTTT